MINLSKNKAEFAAGDKSLFMTYERLDEHNMDIQLKEKNKNGEWENTVFHYILK